METTAFNDYINEMTKNLFTPKKVMVNTKTLNYLVQASSPTNADFLKDSVVLYDSTPPQEESDIPLWDLI